MQILTSSPYATFNSKEWNSLSKETHKFSSDPIKIKKQCFKAFRKITSSEMIEEKNKLPKQMQLSFA